MKRAAYALTLALMACDDGDDCTAVFYADQFSLLIEDANWSTASYGIEVSYTDRFGSAGFLCDLAVPGIAWNGAIDAGFTLVPDAGVDALGNIKCTPTRPTGRLAQGRAGQALLFTFEGSPDTVHLNVRDSDVRVLDQDLAVSYEEVYPDGQSCNPQTRGAVRVKLP